MKGITLKSLGLLLILLLSLSLSSCCIAELFEDDDDVLPGEHNEGGAGDV